MAELSQVMWLMEMKASLELIDLIPIHENFYGPKIVVSPDIFKLVKKSRTKMMMGS